MYDDELVFERDVVEALKEHGWEHGIIKNPTEKDLIKNWAEIIYNNNRQKDRLDKYPLTDTEMQQILDQITELKTPFKLNSFILGGTIGIVRDHPDDIEHHGKRINLKIYDKNEVAAGGSKYQIVEQPIFTTKSPLMNNRRGDLMLLINGMPVFHIELKKSNIPALQAVNQIEKYSNEGVYRGIFALVQIFVAMTPSETLYFANPGEDGQFNPAFYFNWEDFNNEIVTDWKKIVMDLLSIPMAHQMIGFYTVADDSDGILKVMRSYQYFAASAIRKVVALTDWYDPNIRGGYVWHTTGSGKTMTSFKSAQLIANTGDADKVVFLMDRIELGLQSLDEYRGFADEDESVAGTDNTRDLINKLKDDNPSYKLIVTSIQKMSLIKEVTKLYKQELDKINKKRIVIIVDECHRDTFGSMMSDIKTTFPRAVFFGFTGTPIFDENKKNSSLTSDVFGDEIHRYTIADGIRDKNVLGFDRYKVQTFKEMDLRTAVALNNCKANTEEEIFGNATKESMYYKFTTEMRMAGYEDENGKYIRGIEDYIPTSQYDSDEHREIVIDNILENWLRISRNNKFSAILATNSIPEAIAYYRLLKKKNAMEKFKFTVLVDPNIDNNDSKRAIKKEEGLIEILEDYNEMYKQTFSLATSGSFKKDVSNRLAHKKQYKRILDTDKLGLLIVVDQMLTGFDSKWINALYLDKLLQYENVIQAFSRTNRVFKNEEKPFGIIKYYRKPYTMDRNIEKAIKAYSGDKPIQLFVPKLEENVKALNEKFEEIEEIFHSEGIQNLERLPEEKELKRKIAKSYREFREILLAAKIQGYVLPSEQDYIDDEEQEEDHTSNLLKLCDNKFMEQYETALGEVKAAEEEKTYNEEVKDNLENEEIPKVTLEKVNALNARYVELKVESERNPSDIPYAIEGNLTEIDDGRIDYEYMNNRFEKYLKKLSQDHCTEEELEEALSNLHRSFASLSKEQQKFAEMLLNDINSGEVTIIPGKKFMEYVTEYETKASNDKIRQLVDYFGVDEKMLRNLVSLPLTEDNINEYGRFDNLLKTADMKLTQKTLSKLSNREISIPVANIKLSKILRCFILYDEFNI